MKYFASLFILFVFLLPHNIFAACEADGFTVVYVNGIFTPASILADQDRDTLRDKFVFVTGRKDVQFLTGYNASHIGGAGDLIESASQLFNSSVSNYDLNTILLQIHPEVTTRKMLLVGHSQGTFYTNEIYNYLIAHGESKEAVGIYNVATPASFVSGDGAYLTSENDKVINSIRTVALKIGAKQPRPANISIPLTPKEAADPYGGHSFSGVYLANESARIVSNIDDALKKLVAGEVQDTADGGCFIPPPRNISYYAQKLAFSLADTAATGVTTAYSDIASAGEVAYTSVFTAAQSLLRAAETAFAEAEKLLVSRQNLADLLASSPQQSPAQTPVPTPPKPEVVKNAPASQQKVLAREPSDPIAKPEEKIAIPAPTQPIPQIKTSPPEEKIAPPNKDTASSSAQTIPAPKMEAQKPYYPPPLEGSSSGPSAPVPPDPSPPPPPPVPPPPPPPPGPAVALTVSECNQTLSPDACLVATTTLNISWSSTSSDVGHYVITCTTGGSACSSFSFASTTATSTIYTTSNNTSYIFSATAVNTADTAGNQESKTVEIATRPLVINEIAWAGTSAARSEDEWIELYNPTARSITLTNWVLRSATDNAPYITLSGTIAANGYFVLERTDDTTISDRTADKIYAGALVNTGETLELSYASTTIDQTPSLGSCAAWCGGSDSSYTTMERYDPTASGEDSANWGSFQSFLANGKNADTVAINGTPGKRNSLNYLITKNGSSLTQNKILTTAFSPYLITTDFVIGSGATLTINPAVVIKFYNTNAVLTANGTVTAVGTSANPIVFTSFKDDTYGGDTNQDGAATSPTPGNWASIKINGSGSEMDHTIVRYGGLQDGSATYWANIKIGNVSSFTLQNSTIEESGVYGVSQSSGTSTITGNIIRNNNHDSAAAGINLVDGAITVSNSTISSNTFGMKLSSAGGTNAFTISGNTFTGNSQEAIQSVGVFPTLSGNTASTNGTNGINIQGALAQNYTFPSDIPVVVATALTVPSGKTLTILGGTVTKLTNTGSLSISGKLNVNGTNASNAIFTSIKDDTYGGDTNGDGAATTPAAGDWLNLSFASGSSSSTIQYARIRYGGTKFDFDPRGALRVDNASIDILNSTVENSYRAGIWLNNSTSTVVSASTVQNHQDPSSETVYGLYLQSSTPYIANTVFGNNKVGVKADGSSSVTNGGGNTFSGNTTNTDPVGLIP